jgi:hypothetical protein
MRYGTTLICGSSFALTHFIAFKTHGGFSLTIAFPFLWRIALASMEFMAGFNDHSCALFQNGVSRKSTTSVPVYGAHSGLE